MVKHGSHPRGTLAPERAIRIMLGLCLLGLLSACGGSDSPTDTPPPDPPEIGSFTATPTQVELGASATLAWSTTGATTCSINEGVGNVSCNGSAEVTPQAQTTYTLTATGQGGSRTSSVSVALVAPTLATLSPDEGLPGETLQFSLTGTGFASGQTQVTVEGTGVTVSDLVVTDASTLTFTATLATDATPGDRSVRVTTPAGTTSALPFTILPLPVPAVQQVSPTSGTPGSTVTVTFTGSGFVAGATNVAVSGEGVSVENMQVGAAPAPMPGRADGAGDPSGTATATLNATATSLQADLVIAQDAPPGAREITVTTPGGTSDPITFTIDAPPGTGIVELAAGSDHTCAILGADGSAWCFGYGNTGALGGGVFEHSVDPVEVEGDHEFVKLFGGSLYSCGLTASGEAWCWGRNPSGQLGNGSAVDSAEPVPVSGGLTFTQLAPGLAHTCGIATDGSGWCWGSNSQGRLGNGTTTASQVPVPVAGGHTFVSIATSPSGPHSCGVRPDGVGLCWGSGSLGTGPDTNSQSLVPVVVGGGHEFASITIGNSTSCGIATNGAALCWGSGTSGRLGNGSTNPSPTPTEVFGGHTFTEISGSHNGAFCALTTEGQILCWGRGSNYRLGNGSLDNRTIPTPVAGGHTYTSVTMGGSHGCGRTTDGSAWCWGFGSLGRLGNAETDDQPIPVEVTAGPFGATAP